MDKLIEPKELSEEIIAKIANDYIKRYSLKQSVSTTQFHSDTNRLIAELELYSRTIRQLKSLTSGCSTSLQEKMYESMLKLIHFLARYVQRLEIRGYKSSESVFYGERICEGCSSNLNAKKIQTIRRQIFEYLPVFGKEQLQQPQKHRYSQQQSVYLLGNDQTIKRMAHLQRNLQEKQLGLMRCIDQFQDFRANLLVGMPKHSMDRGLQDRFNTKDYVFKLAMHFSNSLKTIEDKISNLKAICKKSEDRSVQCNLKDNSEEQQLKNVMAQQKVLAVRTEAQIKKLNEIKNRLQEHAKIYMVQIKVLNSKLEKIEGENQTLKQQIFVEKLKNKGKNTEENKQQLQTQEQKKVRNRQPSFRQSESLVDDISIANEVLSQLNKRKSQLQQSGARMEEALPYLKNTFKKALDHFISQRASSTIDRKRFFHLDPEQAENSIAKANKKQRKPSKALLNVDSKKKDIIKVQSRMNPRNFLKIFNNEVSYKINGVKRHNTRNLSYSDEKNSTVGENSRKQSRFLYKQSTQLTEGNLKKRGLHVKLSSLSSEVKDSVGLESRSQLEIQYGIYHPQYIQSLSYTVQENQDAGLNLGQKQLNELVERAQKAKLSKHKGQLKRRKNQSMTTLGKLDTVSQKMHNLMKIKKMPHKTLAPEILRNFFEPEADSETSSPNISDKQTSKDTNIEIHGVSSSSRQQRQGPLKLNHKIEQERHAKMKVIFNKVNSLGTTDTHRHQLMEKDHFRRNHNKQTMTLEQLSYLTAFFTLMAQAHLSNQALYAQLKISAFQSSKQNNLSSSQHEQAMMRDTIKQIILKHRKCARSKSLCRHLSEFLLQFNQCLDN